MSFRCRCLSHRVQPDSANPHIFLPKAHKRGTCTRSNTPNKHVRIFSRRERYAFRWRKGKRKREGEEIGNTKKALEKSRSQNSGLTMSGALPVSFGLGSADGPPPLSSHICLCYLGVGDSGVRPLFFSLPCLHLSFIFIRVLFFCLLGEGVSCAADFLTPFCPSPSPLVRSHAHSTTHSLVLGCLFGCLRSLSLARPHLEILPGIHYLQKGGETKAKKKTRLCFNFVFDRCAHKCPLFFRFACSAPLSRHRMTMRAMDIK